MRYQLFHRRIIIERIDILTIVIEPAPPAQLLVTQVPSVVTTDTMPDLVIQPAKVDESADKSADADNAAL